MTDRKEDYQRDGFVLLSNFFQQEEIDRWRIECERLWSLPAIATAADPRVDCRKAVDGSNVIERLDPVIDISPEFRALASDVRVLEIVSQLLGGDVVLFKDKLIRKTPGTTGYRLHQDFAYIEFFGFPADAQAAFCIPLDPSEALSGPIEVFSGKHHRRLKAPADEPYLVDENEIAGVAGQLMELQPTDALMFHSLCPHRSGPNLSTHSRTYLYFTYNLAAVGDLYSEYYRLGKP